jgi:DNA processing protein
VTIVSGGAYGIDGMAHRGCLATGGTTVAALAGGVDRAYPAGHADLLGRIAQGPGVVIAEVPCGTPPTKWRFLQRNRLIAALSDATVVVEAGWRSGSLNTAGHASALGRPLGAVPGPVTSAASAGCHRLLREYDARCVTSADDACELLGTLGDERPTPTDRTDDRTRVLDALSARSPRSPDDLARRAGIAPDEVRGLLAMLELDGRVRRGSDGWRRVTSSS